MPAEPVDPPFHMRPFAPDTDLSGLVRLRDEVENTDQSGEDVGEEALRGQLAWPGHDPARDRWVAVPRDDPKRLMADGLVWKAPAEQCAEVEVVVHPTWRRRGIGGQLLVRLLARAGKLGATQARAYADVRHHEADFFLRKRGFAPVAAYTELRAPGNLPLEEPDLPTGYYVRSYDGVRRPPVLLDALNRCYEDLWGHHSVTALELEDWLPTRPAEGIFLAFAPDSSLAGICRAELDEHLSARRGALTGHVDAPGVVPALRDQGLHRPLLLTAMRWLHAQQPAAFELESWGDDPQTLALYQAMGFTVVRQAASYRLDLG